MSRDFSDVCEELGVAVDDVDFIYIYDGVDYMGCLRGDEIYGSYPDLVIVEIVLKTPGVWYTTNASNQAETAVFQDFSEESVGD